MNPPLNENLVQVQKSREEAAHKLVATASDLVSVKNDVAGISQDRNVLTEKLGKTEEQRVIAEGRARTLADEKSGMEVELKKTRFVNRFVLAPLILSALLAALALFVSPSFDLSGSRRVMALCLAFTLPVLIACWAIRLFPKQLVTIESWWLPQWMKRFAWLVTFLVVLSFEGVFQGFIYDKFKDLNPAEATSNTK